VTEVLLPGHRRSAVTGMGQPGWQAPIWLP